MAIATTKQRWVTRDVARSLISEGLGLDKPIAEATLMEIAEKEHLIVRTVGKSGRARTGRYFVSLDSIEKFLSRTK